MYPRKLTRSVISNPDFPVAVTKRGKIRGLYEEDMYIFRGIQYATAERFHEAKPVEPWEGNKDAIIYGPVSPEIHTPIAHDEYNVPHYHYVQDEECLYLNIWTKQINEDAKKPVMVWIHGGGYATGSSIELYAYDGHELAEFGDVVVVSVNHRLNVIGYLDLSAYGEEYKYTGNLGQKDLVEALRWIQENIEAFGGDPGNVMIMGQSGGGGKVNSLLQTPSAKGLFHRASIQSGLFEGEKDVLPETSQKLASYVVEELGLSAETIHEIEKVPYYKLARAAQKAQEKLAKETGQFMMMAPVKDDDFFMGSGLNNPFIEEHKNVPVLVGSVYGEFDQNYNAVYAPGSKNDWDDELVLKLIQEVFGESADAVIEAMKKDYPERKLVDCLYTNKATRAASRDYAKKRAEEGCAPAWNWMFNLECPLNSGTIPWHNAEEAYMFHNANYLEASYIPGVSERLQDQMTGAWVAFSRNGDPNVAGNPVWPAVTADNGSCILFDRETTVRYHHDDELMDSLPNRGVMGRNDRKSVVNTRFGGGPRQSL